MDIILIPILKGVMSLLSIYYWVIFIRIILSLLFALNILNPNGGVVTNIYSALYQLTEPAFAYVRRFIPPFGMFDFSPIVVIIAVNILMEVISRVIIKIDAISISF